MNFIRRRFWAWQLKRIISKDPNFYNDILTDLTIYDEAYVRVERGKITRLDPSKIKIALMEDNS